jgi:hypothetical protein
MWVESIKAQCWVSIVKGNSQNCVVLGTFVGELESSILGALTELESAYSIFNTTVYIFIHHPILFFLYLFITILTFKSKNNPKTRKYISPTI